MAMTKSILKNQKPRPTSPCDSTASPNALVMLTIEEGCDVASPMSRQSADTCDEAIRSLAYLNWEAAGCPAGDGVEFWLEAEREINKVR